MKETTRWQERFQSFSKALHQLEKALQQKNFSILEKDGVIKRFEFTVELAWKTLQDLLNERGYTNVKGPKPVIKQAFQDGVLEDGQAWIDMLNDRNKSAHLYDESAATEIFSKIQTQYFHCLQNSTFICKNKQMNRDSQIKFGLSQKQCQLIEEVLEQFEEIEKVVIFGSRATDKYKPASDIDLAVFGKDITVTILDKFYSALDDLPLPFMFDLLNYSKISNTSLKSKIDSYGKIFFERRLKTV